MLGTSGRIALWRSNGSTYSKDIEKVFVFFPAGRSPIPNHDDSKCEGQANSVRNNGLDETFFLPNNLLPYAR